MRRTFLLIALLCAPALQAGTVLRGGAFSTIERPAALPANAEEWEAFLSFDGGRYYAVRITPHLDVARRQFTWVVPNVETGNARILIRAGDERRETLYELPERFSIVRDARAALPRRGIVPAANGEAARAGDPGVVAWTDGDRSGGAVIERFSRGDHAGVAARHARRERNVVAVAAGVLGSSFLVVSLPIPPPQTKNQEPRTKNPVPANILLTISRLNI
jgi:hypothetical protein